MKQKELIIKGYNKTSLQYANQFINEYKEVEYPSKRAYILVEK